MYKRFVLVLACIVLNVSAILAIEPTWSVDFGAVFDNREGDAKYSEAKTYFFTTLAPEIGLKFTPTDRISGGAVWNQPLENGIKRGKITPTLYYRHEAEKWKFSMGMFPMTQLREPLPNFLWCDSLAYFQRNIRGALMQYEDNKGFIDAYIDWRGMQSETTREAFNIVAHGEWWIPSSVFLIGGHGMMNHFARTRNAPENQFVVDNFLVNPYIGADFSRKTALDSLVFKTGAIITVERNREFGNWKTPAGFWLEALVEWKFLGARNSLYCGGKLFPLYGEFANELYLGEAYYSSSFYDRLDLCGHIYRNKFMDLEAQLNFNFAKGSFIFYQRLILNISLGN